MTPEQQVTARIGDVIVYLTDITVAGRIRQQWDAAQYLAATRLPERVSQTWLAPQTGHLPARHRAAADRPGRGRHPVDPRPPRNTDTPPYLRVRVDRLVWQVCDRQSWQRIGQAWFDAQQHLSG